MRTHGQKLRPEPPLRDPLEIARHEDLCRHRSWRTPRWMVFGTLDQSVARQERAAAAAQPGVEVSAAKHGPIVLRPSAAPAPVPTPPAVPVPSAASASRPMEQSPEQRLPKDPQQAVRQILPAEDAAGLETQKGDSAALGSDADRAAAGIPSGPASRFVGLADAKSIEEATSSMPESVRAPVEVGSGNGKAGLTGPVVGTRSGAEAVQAPCARRRAIANSGTRANR